MTDLKNQSRIEIIQAMRLFAAIGITIFHCQFLGNHGYFGVEIFNVISGFIVVYNTENKRRCSWFLLKKFIRIVPLYWTFTFLFYGIISIIPSISVMSEAKPEYLIKSMLFIPFTNSRGFETPILGAGWTLNYEMFFYLIFFLAIHISHKHRALICGTVLTGLVILHSFFAESFIAQYYTNSILLEFVMGLIAFYILKLLSRIRIHKTSRFILSVIVVVMVILLAVNETAYANVARCFRLGIPAVILFTVLICLNRDKEFPNIFVKLGNATYSIYLVEYFTSAAYKLFSANKNMGIRFAMLILCILVTLLIGYFSYKIVEIRFGEWIKRKLKVSR